MPTALTLDFSDLGSGTSIPETYKGFHWKGYQLDETFGGSVGLVSTTPPAKAIHGVGFQVSAEAGNSFDLTSISIASATASGQLDLTINAKFSGEQAFVKVASVFADTVNGQAASLVFNLPLKNIDQLQIYSNAMETFRAYDIKVEAN